MKAQDLRNSILQMAVQGKLVPQDPADEPASALLERIREERRKLIAEGKLKAPKGGESVIYRASDGSHYEKRIDAMGRESEPVCIDDEIPFEIPESWEWVRLEAGLVNRDAERIPVSVAEREKREKIYDYYGASGVIDGIDDYLFDKPLLLIGEDGANLLNRTTPIAFIAEGKYWVNNHAHVLDGISSQYLRYVALYINSISLAPYVTGTAQPKMNQQKMGMILIPLPPEGQQGRILNRYDELRPLLDQYDALETAREELDAELPERLRKSILQMAVQGKLVPQDPADEPASVLLERIREERRRLIAEGKLKAPKGGESVIYRASDGGYYEKRIDAKGRESEPVCIEDEIPFEIPEGWEWSRLGSICNYGQCVNIDFKDIEDETWILELEQIERDTGLVVEKVRKHGGVGSTKHLFKKGDVLYSKLRPYLNKVVIADEDGAATSEIFPLDFLGQIDAQYVQIALMSPYFIDYADSCSYGVKMPRLGTSDGQHALLPVPPRSEQDRIAGFVNAALPLVTSR